MAAVKKVKSVLAASNAVKLLTNRRITAMEGVGYKMLVAIDETKECWKALKGVLYLADNAQDVLSTITIKDGHTSPKIRDEIKRVVEDSGIGFKSSQVKINMLQQNHIRSKDRVIEFMAKGDYDLFGLGIQGRKSSDINPKRVLGSFHDPSMRKVTCTTLFAPSCAELPEKDERAVFVVVVDGSSNSNHAYETARAWLKENDYLYVIKVVDPRGDEPDVPRKMRSSFLGKQYSGKLKDLSNSSFEVITGKLIVPEIIQFCREKGAHFLLCAADEMGTWSDKGEAFASVSDNLVREGECFVIISQRKIVQKE